MAGIGRQSEGLTTRTFVRYCTRMSNDRSYLDVAAGLLRAAPRVAVVRVDRQLLGLRSKSSVAALVARLKLAGFLESTPDRRLAPTRRFFARPLAESPVRAGMPDAVDDSDSRRAHASTTT